MRNFCKNEEKNNKNKAFFLSVAKNGYFVTSYTQKTVCQNDILSVFDFEGLISLLFDYFLPSV